MLPPPSRVAPGQPVRAVTINGILAAVEEIRRGLSAADLGALRRLANFIAICPIVGVSASVPSPPAAVTYDVSEGGVVHAGLSPSLGRPTDDPAALIVPAALEDLCVLVRVPDAVGLPRVQLWVLTEQLALTPCPEPSQERTSAAVDALVREVAARLVGQAIGDTHGGAA